MILHNTANNLVTVSDLGNLFGPLVLNTFLRLWIDCMQLIDYYTLAIGQGRSSLPERY